MYRERIVPGERVQLCAEKSPPSFTVAMEGNQQLISKTLATSDRGRGGFAGLGV